MKTLSLQQPYASLVVLGLKTVETRSWKTKHRGELLIHSSAGKKKEFREYYEQFQKSGVLQDTPLDGVSFDDLPFGKVLGRVELDECYKSELFFDPEIEDRATGVEIDHNEFLFGDYSPNRYGWRLFNPETFGKPIPAKGKLSIWEWDECLETCESCEKLFEITDLDMDTGSNWICESCWDELWPTEGYVIEIPCSNNRMSYYDENREGDPGRTMKLNSATKYSEFKVCGSVKALLQKRHPNREFKINHTKTINSGGGCKNGGTGTVI